MQFKNLLRMEKNINKSHRISSYIGKHNSGNDFVEMLCFYYVAFSKYLFRFLKIDEKRTLKATEHDKYENSAGLV
jgi:hypothetical protein